MRKINSKTMDDIIQKLSEILEVENLDITRRFKDYDEWDSLTSLSIIAMLDSDYNLSMTFKEIASFDSIESFCKEVIDRK